MPVPAHTPIHQESTGTLTTLFKINEQKAYGRPYKLPYTHDKGDEYAGTGRQGKACSWHDEAALAPAKLQWDEKQQIGEQAGKSKYEHALGENDIGGKQK